METYQQLKLRQSKEFDNFTGIFFAFSDEQFKEGLKEFGLENESSLKDKLVSIGAGGFVLSSKLEEFESLVDRHNKEIQDLKNNKQILLEALSYELMNHEYGYTRDIQQTLDSLGLKLEDIPKDILEKAKEEALRYE